MRQKEKKFCMHLAAWSFVTIGYVLFTAGCATAPVPEQIRSDLEESGDYITQISMWADRGVRVHGTNYRQGDHIPPGTQVRVLEVTGNEIEFAVPEWGDRRIQLVNNRHHTRVTITELFERTFGREDVDLSGMSQAIREAVKDGNVIQGMNKDQVLKARGYPPFHHTPGLEADEWRYWTDRILTREVRFDEGGKVVEIID